MKTSDIARLMELFQSALLHYWKFNPHKENVVADDPISSQGTKVEDTHQKLPSRDTERSMEKLPESEPRTTFSMDNPVRRMPVIFFDEAHKL